MTDSTGAKLSKSLGNVISVEDILNKYGIDVEPFPVDFRSEEIDLEYLKNPFNWIPSSIHLHSNSLALREILGRIYYELFI